MSIWNDAIERCVEGRCTPDELADLLMRIDLPEEGRRAINQTLSMVNGLNRSCETPEAPADAKSRLLERLRSQPFSAGLGSLSARLSTAAGSPNSVTDLPETEEQSEADEFGQLAAALDSFHRSMPVPGGAQERALELLAHTDDPMDVRAAFDAGGERTAQQNAQQNESPTVIRLPADFFDPNAPPDVLAASKETPPPNVSSAPKITEAPDSAGEKRPD
jgi:hypothetical protein